jgi:general secretion pathway protein A
MYREYFGFKAKPFGLTPDTRFVFLSDNHREGLAHLWYGLHQGGGFIVLTGEVGTGKTTLLRTLLARLRPDKWRSALIFNPPLSPDGLFREILRELGLPADDQDSTRLMRALNSYLLRENVAGRSVLLVLDEAQNLRPEILEKIRLLSNLETESRKLLHIVLVGQPELGIMLDRQDLRQLRQRVSVRCHLQSMNAVDTGYYIEHRLKRAGGGNNPIFSSRALHKIYRFTGGIPRMINILCDRCLLVAFVGNQKNVTAGIVGKAVAELKASRHSPPLSGNSRIGLVIVFILLMGWPVYWGISHFSWPTSDLPLAFSRVVGTPDSPVEDASRQPQETGSRKAGKIELEAAFDALARAWKVPELADGEKISGLGDLWEAAKGRGLEVSGVRGSMIELLDLGYPVLVQVRDVDGIKAVAVLEENQGRVLVVPAVDNQSWITRSQLNRLCCDDAFLFWRNDLNVPRVLLSGSRGREVKALQELLLAAGYDKIKIDGVFGGETDRAIKAFQLQQGLEPDGNLGMATLLRLYQSAEKFGVPKLRKG